jgi:hypothetical protein
VLLPFSLGWRNGGRRVRIKNLVFSAIFLLGLGWFSTRVFNFRNPGFS